MRRLRGWVFSRRWWLAVMGLSLAIQAPEMYDLLVEIRAAYGPSNGFAERIDRLVRRASGHLV